MAQVVWPNVTQITPRDADHVNGLTALFGNGVGEEDARVDLAGATETRTHPEVRLFGSGTYTARLAGALGVPFAANYHSAPTGTSC